MKLFLEQFNLQGKVCIVTGKFLSNNFKDDKYLFSLLFLSHYLDWLSHLFKELVVVLESKLH